MASDTNNADGTDKKYEQKKDEEEDLSEEEDMELKHLILQDSETGLKRNALESLRHEIRTSTSSMTAVPKPLKFLHPNYATLKAFYETMADPDFKKLLADILSVLALTMSAKGDRFLQESLNYRLLGTEGDIDWGHAYVRNLAGEISQEYVERRSGEDNESDDLMELVGQIIVFLLKHNAEHEAVDLLLEVEDLSTLVDHCENPQMRPSGLKLFTGGLKHRKGFRCSIRFYMEIYHIVYPTILFLDVGGFVQSRQYVLRENEQKGCERGNAIDKPFPYTFVYETRISIGFGNYITVWEGVKHPFRPFGL